MDITWPAGFPYTGTDTNESLFTLFYDVGGPDSSLAVVNGYIEDDNFASTFELEDIHTQRGSIVNAWSSSGNSNLDYIARVFGGYDFDTEAGDQFRMPALPGESKIYIPGANRTFYLPVDSYIIVFWTVYWNTQSVPGTDVFSKVYFVVDNTLQQDNARNVGVTTGATSAITNLETNRGYAKARTFHGHYVTPNGSELSQGWHTVGLAVLSEPDVVMTRIHSCDIVVLAIKA